MFINPEGEKGDIYKFCTELEKIGAEFDVSLANGSFITPISDSIEINHPKYGPMMVTKIKADVATDYRSILKEFWIPSEFIVRLKDDPS